MVPQTFTADTCVLSRNCQQFAQTWLQLLTLQFEEEPSYRSAVKAVNFFARENMVSMQFKSYWLNDYPGQ